MARNWGLSNFFGLSTNWSFETLGVASVRTSVRTSGTLFLRNRSSDFYEILYEVRVQKVRKNVPSAFLIIFTVLAILAKNSPKWVFLAQSDKKWRFFAFFSRTTHQIFLFFCSKHSLWSRKKMTFSLFLGNFQIWPKFAHFWSDVLVFDIFVAFTSPN